MSGAKNLAFKTVRLNKPGRSMFDLSYEKKLTCDMGQLIPVMCDEVVPGDFFQLGNMAVIRFQPLVAPTLHEINMYVHYFFVPYRILWDEWEDFISGGVDGMNASTLPRWTPTTNTKGSLWDYLGFPPGVNPTGALPMAFPKNAYNLIYNEYYRDETLQTKVDLNTQEAILNRCWEKDYFTSSLPWQQRGIAPALPIAGTSSAVWPAVVSGSNQMSSGTGNVPGNQWTKDTLENNTVDLSVASTFDMADFRLAFQIQRWLERNARAGARYVEFLKSHFGTAPRDDRLQRPEFIAGTKSRIIISEVLQTSGSPQDTGGYTTTPQGNMAGHGIGISTSFAGKYHATEYGLIMGIMSVLPRSAYMNGINRQWLRETKYDFYFPEFAHLSEQLVTLAELCAKTTDSVHNLTPFGYQGRYDELRTKQNMVVADMRDTFDYWHLARKFDPATPPALNAEFVECVPDKRIFAVQDEAGLIVSFGNLIKASRPLPILAEPGFIDH